MPHQTEFAVPISAPRVSPLILCDRLIALAEDADRAGHRLAARKLVRLACDLLDPPTLATAH